MSPTWKAAIGVLLVFILGWLGGALSTGILLHHKITVLVQGNAQAMALLLERRTTRGLELDAGQKAQIHQLLLENVRQRKQLQGQIQPQVWACNRQTLQSIDSVLTAKQQQKFQDNLLLFKARFGRDPLGTGPEKAAADAAPIGTASPSTNAAPTPAQ